MWSTAPRTTGITVAGAALLYYVLTLDAMRPHETPSSADGRLPALRRSGPELDEGRQQHLLVVEAPDVLARALAHRLEALGV
jgi:hypothetical protein